MSNYVGIWVAMGKFFRTELECFSRSQAAIRVFLTAVIRWAFLCGRKAGLMILSMCEPQMI